MNQVRAYPVSPQSVCFDNISIENMFSIRTDFGSHCLIVSPFLWTIITILLGLLISAMMLIFKRYVTHPIRKKTHQGWVRVRVRVGWGGVREEPHPQIYRYLVTCPYWKSRSDVCG